LLVRQVVINGGAKRKITMAVQASEIALMPNDRRLCDDSEETFDASIARLVARARSGDGGAFDQIMMCYQRRVVSVAWQLLGSEDDARDAAQEVFLRVYKYLKSYRSGESFSGWLYRINVNVCRDIARKRSHGVGLASLDLERELGTLDALASGEDIEAAAIFSQECSIITRAMDSLPGKEREAIVLRDLQGLSTEEVARVLGSSASTVRSQICSARKKVKQYRDRLIAQRRQR
jgi:RNA polymerase sigma-70 factor (ECF subfamily)